MKLISPGIYDVLLDIFSTDTLATSRIRAAACMIRGMASRREQPASSSAQSGQSAKSELIPDTSIKVEIKSLPIEREMTNMFRELIKVFKVISPKQSPIQIGYEITKNTGQAATNTQYVEQFQSYMDRFETILRNAEITLSAKEIRKIFMTWFQMLQTLEKQHKMPVSEVGWHNATYILVKKLDSTTDYEHVKHDIRRCFGNILRDIGYGRAEIKSVSTSHMTPYDLERLIPELKN